MLVHHHQQLLHLQKQPGHLLIFLLCRQYLHKTCKVITSHRCSLCLSWHHYLFLAALFRETSLRSLIPWIPREDNLTAGMMQSERMVGQSQGWEIQVLKLRNLSWYKRLFNPLRLFYQAVCTLSFSKLLPQPTTGFSLQKARGKKSCTKPLSQFLILNPLQPEDKFCALALLQLILPKIGKSGLWQALQCPFLSLPVARTCLILLLHALMASADTQFSMQNPSALPWHWQGTGHGLVVKIQQ